MRSCIGFLLFAAILVIVALFVFRTPDLNVVELEAKYAATPSKFITLPLGERVHYRVQGYGEGRTIVLMHGTSDSLHTWEPWVKQLGKEYRIITFDLPGHGLTGPVPGCDYSVTCAERILHEFTRALHLDHYVLGGNSLGGNIAWRYALAWPDGIDGLILLDASGAPEAKRTRKTLAFVLARIPLVNRMLEIVTPRELVKKGLEDAFYKDSMVSTTMVNRFWELGRRPGNRHALVMRMNAADNNTVWRAHLKDMDIPTLILWGREDTFVDISAGQWLSQTIPHATYTVYDQVGHLPHLEVPKISASNTRTFLENLPPLPVAPPVDASGDDVANAPATMPEAAQ